MIIYFINPIKESVRKYFIKDYKTKFIKYIKKEDSPFDLPPIKSYPNTSKNTSKEIPNIHLTDTFSNESVTSNVSASPPKIDRKSNSRKMYLQDKLVYYQEFYKLCNELENFSELDDELKKIKLARYHELFVLLNT